MRLGRILNIEIAGDRLQGLVCISDLGKRSAGEWARPSVREIMTPAAELAVIGPESDAAQALKLLAERDVNQLPVVKGSKLVGLIQRADLVAWIGLNLDRRPSATEPQR